MNPEGVYEDGSSGSLARTLKTPVVRFKEKEVMLGAVASWIKLVACIAGDTVASTVVPSPFLVTVLSAAI